MRSPLVLLALVCGAAVASACGGGCASPARSTPSSASDGGASAQEEVRAAASTRAAVMPSAHDIVLVGAGDISSCRNDDDEKTARLVERVLASASPRSRAFTAGDNVYPGGEKESYRACYLPTWGRFLKDTLPVAGNHDWMTPDAAGYFATFGPAAGTRAAPWRAVTVGAWRVILLDSNCEHVGGCERGSPQHAWLEAELRRTPTKCTLAIWHHPLASSGPHGSDDRTADLWAALDAAGAELVIAGHDHIYERFAPLTADGALAAAGQGLRSFVIGTGGASAYELRFLAATGSEARHTGDPAVLVLTLRDDGVAWRAITVDERTLDEGQASCR